MAQACYSTNVTNPNDIWKSENILDYYLPSLATEIAFMVFTTRVLYYILRPFNQPRMVAEMIVGLLLSPDILGEKMFFKTLFNIKSILVGETVSYVGLVYYAFLAGLDMNLETILRARKKARSIAFAGTAIPMLAGAGIYALFQNMCRVPDSHHNYKSYFIWMLTLSVTSFPTLVHILADLKLIYTGLGRVALTSAMVNDFFNWAMFAAFVPYVTDPGTAPHSVLGTAAFVAFCFLVVRRRLVKVIVEKTNANDWDNYQLFWVVMGAFVCAAITDLLGTHPVVGALVYGLMIPRGKFTDMLIEKSEDFGAGCLLPLFFVSVGIRFRLVAVIGQHGIWLVLVTLLLSCIPKILSTVVATMFFGMPPLDGLALGFLMNTKGILPLIALNLAWDKQIVSRESYSILMASTLAMTAMAPLVINALYKPRRRYEQNKLRTVQNLKAGAELRILACVHNPRQATGMVNILEACNAIETSPLRLFGLQLVELTGSNTALLAAHIDQKTLPPQQQQQQQGGSSSLQALTKSQRELEVINSIFKQCAEENGNTKSVETLSAASVYSTIHEDVFNLAQEKQTSFILLPFHKHATVEGVLEETNAAFKEINQNVMKDAPCSVGIFVDRGLGSLFKVSLRVVVIFLGGPDDREALAIAWRMSKHQSVQVSVVRLVLVGEADEADASSTAADSKGLFSTVLDSEKQREFDEEYLSSFRLKAVNNGESVTYAEREVSSGDDLQGALNELDRVGYDLYLVGQGSGRSSSVLSGLSKWTDCPELGVIGDVVASDSFDSSSSVLVVRQYGFGGVVFEDNNNQHPSETPGNNDGSQALFVKVE